MDTPERERQAMVLADRAAAARVSLEAVCKQLETSRQRLNETRRQVQSGRSAREILHESALARMAARLESMPVKSRPRAS